MKPGFEYVRTHWKPDFIASGSRAGTAAARREVRAGSSPQWPDGETGSRFPMWDPSHSRGLRSASIGGLIPWGRCGCWRTSSGIRHHRVPFSPGKRGKRAHNPAIGALAGPASGHEHSRKLDRRRRFAFSHSGPLAFPLDALHDHGRASVNRISGHTRPVMRPTMMEGAGRAVTGGDSFPTGPGQRPIVTSFYAGSGPRSWPTRYPCDLRGSGEPQWPPSASAGEVKPGLGTGGADDASG
jgi:hypothetical protein